MLISYLFRKSIEKLRLDYSIGGAQKSVRDRSKCNSNSSLHRKFSEDSIELSKNGLQLLRIGEGMVYLPDILVIWTEAHVREVFACYLSSDVPI